MGSAGRYYGAYLIYDVANSCLATLHAKMPSPLDVTRANPPSPVHVQNPRKFCSKLSSSYSFTSSYIFNYFFLFFLPLLFFFLSFVLSFFFFLLFRISLDFRLNFLFDLLLVSNINFISYNIFFFIFSCTCIGDKNYKDTIFISIRSKNYDRFKIRRFHDATF